MMISSIFQKRKDLEWEQLDHGVKRCIYGYGSSLMLVAFEFEKGGQGLPHSHPHEQASVVESGVFELTIGDEVMILKKGDGYFVPSDTIHSCLCIEEGILIDAFSPVREDFLGK